jgi:HrpA-like RNA helicase
MLDEALPSKSEPKKYFKSTNLTLRQQKEQLPIFTYKKQLLQACWDNNILIIIG